MKDYEMPEIPGNLEALTWTATTSNGSMPNVDLHGLSDVIAFIASGIDTNGYGPEGIKFEMDCPEHGLGTAVIDPLLPIVLAPLPGSKWEGSEVRVTISLRQDVN